MIYHILSVIYYYVRFMNSGQIGYVFGMIGSGGMAAMGLWCVMFATGAASISKRTGADKRTSGFPFKNVEAEKKRGGKRL